MAIVDDLIGTMVVIFFTVMTVLIIFFQVQESNFQSLDLWRKHEIQENYENHVNSYLITMEPKTNLPYGILLGSSAYYRTSLIPYKGGSMNISDSFEKLIRISEFSNDYYFSIQPTYDEISLIFFIDGSDSLEDEILDLSNNLDDYINLANNTFDTVNISVEIQFLDFANSSKCDLFTGHTCNYTKYGDFYYNRTYTVNDINNFEYNLTRPNYFHEEEEVWKSDWETATMSYIINHPINLSRLEILIPVTDSLPSSTKLLYPCPKEYSEKILERDQKIIKEHFSIISPIYSLNIDSARFCDDYAINHINNLINNTPGIIFKSRGNIILDNFFKDIHNNLKIEGGLKKTKQNNVIERRLPMPNGNFAYLRFEVYHE